MFDVSHQINQSTSEAHARFECSLEVLMQKSCLCDGDEQHATCNDATMEGLFRLVCRVAAYESEQSFEKLRLSEG